MYQIFLIILLIIKTQVTVISNSKIDEIISDNALFSFNCDVQNDRIENSLVEIMKKLEILETDIKKLQKENKRFFTDERNEKCSYDLKEMLEVNHKMITDLHADVVTKINKEWTKIISWDDKIKILRNNPDKNFVELVSIGQQLTNIEPHAHKNNMEALVIAKTNLPEAVQHILWSKLCLRCNELDGALPYLYAQNNTQIFPSPNGDQQIAVYHDGNGSKPAKGYEWTFEFSEDKTNFYIKNILTDSYLYATEELYFSDKRFRKLSLAEKSSTNSFKWKLTPSNSLSKFDILNVEFDEHLDWWYFYNKSGNIPPNYWVCTLARQQHWIFEECSM